MIIVFPSCLQMVQEVISVNRLAQCTDSVFYALAGR